MSRVGLSSVKTAIAQDGTGGGRNISHPHPFMALKTVSTLQFMGSNGPPCPWLVVIVTVRSPRAPVVWCVRVFFNVFVVEQRHRATLDIQVIPGDRDRWLSNATCVFYLLAPWPSRGSLWSDKYDIWRGLFRLFGRFHWHRHGVISCEKSFLSSFWLCAAGFLLNSPLAVILNRSALMR